MRIAATTATTTPPRASAHRRHASGSATARPTQAEQASAPLTLAQDASEGVGTGLRPPEGPRRGSAANAAAAKGAVRASALDYYAVEGRGACLVVLVDCAGKDALGPDMHAPGCVGTQHCPPPVDWWSRMLEVSDGLV